LYFFVDLRLHSLSIKVEVALASDAARLITDAVESAPEEFKVEAQELECNSDSQWEIGEEFINHMLTVGFTK
jgi:hypothetical protein